MPCFTAVACLQHVACFYLPFPHIPDFHVKHVKAQQQCSSNCNVEYQKLMKWEGKSEWDSESEFLPVKNQNNASGELNDVTNIKLLLSPAVHVCATRVNTIIWNSVLKRIWTWIRVNVHHWLTHLHHSAMSKQPVVRSLSSNTHMQNPSEKRANKHTHRGHISKRQTPAVLGRRTEFTVIIVIIAHKVNCLNQVTETFFSVYTPAMKLAERNEPPVARQSDRCWHWTYKVHLS